MPPPNMTPATAIAITAYPFTVATDPEAAANPLYYKLTGPATYGLVGVWCDNASWTSGHYLTRVAVMDADGVTAYLGLSTIDAALQVPIAPAQVLYLRLENAVGTYTAGDLVHLSVVLPSNAVMAPGQLLINDDTNGFPLCVLTDTGALVRFQPVVAGERGAILPTGVSLWQDRSSAGFNPGGTGVFGHQVNLYDASLSLLAEVTGVIADTDTAECVIATNRIDHFYVVQNRASLNPIVRTIDTAGAIGATTWTLPANAVNCIAACPNVAETILYYASGNLNAPVRRYDLLTQTELATFLPGYGVNYSVLKDILVLADDTVVIAFYNNAGATQTFKILHCSTDGTVRRQWDYNANTGMASQAVNRLAYNAAQSAASFWVWIYTPVDPSDTTWEYTVASHFAELSVATGAALRAFDIQNYEVGVSTASAQWDGVRFGPSTSCPLLVLPASSVSGAEPPYVAPSYHLDARYIRRLRRAPHLAQENTRVFYRRFELDLERGVGLATGQGSDPTVMLRLSRDGGHTWGEPLTMSAGTLGAYTTRVIARRLGQARDTVFEVTVSDPVAWSLVNAWLDLEPGTS
jgi:hypothetical protein